MRFGVNQACFAEALSAMVRSTRFNETTLREVVRVATVKDVAALARVSLGTVSNVLNRPERVLPDTRRRVEQAMADLGFVRNEAARHLRSGRSRSLAYVMLDAANPFFTDVAAGIEEAAEESLFSLYMCNSGNRADREAGYLAHLARAARAGHPRHPARPRGRAPRRRRAPRHATGHRRPHHSRRLALLGCRRRRAGRHAGRRAPPRPRPPADRLRRRPGVDRPGPRPARGRSPGPGGGRGDDITVIATEATTVREGRLAGERLLGLAGKKRPTAAFCANDLLALGLLQQLVASGLASPTTSRSSGTTTSTSRAPPPCP